MSQDLHAGASPNARFLAGEVTSGKLDAKRAGEATLVSVLIHVGFVLLVIVAIANPPQALTNNRDELPSDIVWLDTPGPGGGGGGGGNEMKEPPRKVELKGEEKVSVPVAKVPKMEIAKEEPPKPPIEITIPAQQTATGVMELPGMVSNVPTAITPSQGSGTGGGAGTGQGTGIGPGRGSGLGDGYGGGTGGEPGLQLRWVGVRQPPTDAVGELEHGRHAQTAVEVVVEQDLRCRPSPGRVDQSCSPLKYGMPSAAGGRNRLAKIVTTTSVTTYGVM